MIPLHMHTHTTVICDYPATHHPVFLVTGSQNNHLLIEGQYIIYTCPPGFVLIGPNASVCTRSGEWEPDPGEVDCIGDDYTQRYYNNTT